MNWLYELVQSLARLLMSRIEFRILPSQEEQDRAHEEWLKDNGFDQITLFKRQAD